MVAQQGAVQFVKRVVAVVSDRNVSFMAGSIAYQAFVSLIPLLVLVFFLVSAVGDEALADRVAAAAEGSLPQSGQELLFEAIAGSVATAGASIIGLVTLLWGSLKIFRGLDTAFSEIYGTTGETSFLDDVRDGLIVFGAIGTALVAAGVASAVFALLPNGTWIGLLNPILLVAGLTLAFYPMYYVFPDLELTKREALPGVVVAAVGWAALQGLFQVYVAFASEGAGGALGAILLLLTWLYFGGFVLLIGAVVNAVYGGRIPDPAAAAGPEGEGASGAAAESVAGIAADRPTAASGRDVAALERRVEELSRERDRLRNDLAAERSRRDDLEVEARLLFERLDDLERANERLRRRLERRRGPWWRRLARRLADRASTVSVGTVRRSR